MQRQYRGCLRERFRNAWPACRKFQIGGRIVGKLSHGADQFLPAPFRVFVFAHDRSSHKSDEQTSGRRWQS